MNIELSVNKYIQELCNVQAEEEDETRCSGSKWQHTFIKQTKREQSNTKNQRNSI